MKNKSLGGSIVEFVLVWPLAASLLLGGLDLFRLAAQKIFLMAEAKKTALAISQLADTSPGEREKAAQDRISRRFSNEVAVGVGERIISKENKQNPWSISLITVSLSTQPNLLFKGTRLFWGDPPVLTASGSGVRWERRSDL